MKRAFSAPTVADQADLYRVVADLATYPEWLGLVHRVEPDTGDPTGDPDGPAYHVTLRARIGPLARSKRLRMVRTVHDGTRVRFERRELDGRNHSAWVLSAEVGPRHDDLYRSEVAIDLRYDGSLWSALLDGVLGAAADDATERLQIYVTARA